MFLCGVKMSRFYAERPAVPQVFGLRFNQVAKTDFFTV
jgi:hypothetical protein